MISQSRRVTASGDSQVANLLAQHPETLEQESTFFWINYRRKLLHWAADQVKPDFHESSWQSFLLTAVEGQKPEDVAQQLGVSVGSVYAAKFRIVARIRKIIAKLDDFENVENEMSIELSNKFRNIE